MKRLPPRAAVALSLITAALMLAAFRPMPVRAAELPATQRQGTVEYMTGGISTDESQAFDRISKDWPLTLEFSQAMPGAARGQFLADVKVEVRAAQGAATFTGVSKGPYLLLKLPAGRYSVNATWQGKTLTRDVDVKTGAPTRVSMSWPPA